MLKEIGKGLVERVVLDCFYNICNYYNVDKKIIKKYMEKNKVNKITPKLHQKEKNKSLIYWNINDLLIKNGANEVVIYNFWALLTIDTNNNQFTKVYHIFDRLQYK